MTGLPEYRNGGLLIDTGLLTLKKDDMDRGLDQYHKNAEVKGQPKMEVVPLFVVDDDVIVEWRACTVGFLDELLATVNEMLGLKGKDRLSLPQMLEAGTWKVRFSCSKRHLVINKLTCYYRVAERSQKSQDRTQRNRRL